jgi:hypothetical protein
LVDESTVSFVLEDSRMIGDAMADWIEVIHLHPDESVEIDGHG